MSSSVHAVVAPLWNQLLPGVLTVLDKAEAHCQETGIAPSELLEARLAPDMWDLATQVRMVAIHSAGAINAAMTGEIVLGPQDQPADIATLRQAISDAITQVNALKADELDARASEDITMRVQEHLVPFLAEDFLVGFALPNFVFHVTAAYAILRMKGVAIGKMDYLGSIPVKQG